MRSEWRGAAALLLVITLIISLMNAQQALMNSSNSSSKGSGNLKLVKVRVRSSAGTSQIYPGSKGATLMLDIRNNEAYNISYVQGCFTFPEGITPSDGYGYCVEATDLNGKYKAVFVSGEIFRLTIGIDVNKSVKPGRYKVVVNVSYTLIESNGSRVRKYEIIDAYINISKYPPVKLVVTDMWWASYRVYPGTSGASLYLRVKNVGETNINGGYAVLILPKPFIPRKVRVNFPAVNTDSEATIEFTGIDIPVTAKPGTYTALVNISLKAVTKDGVTYDYYPNLTIKLTISKPLKPLIKVVNAGWVTNIVYPNSRAVTIYVTLQNLDHSRIDVVIAKLYLPRNVVVRGGRNYSVTTYSTPVGFGGVFTLRFTDINLSVKPNESIKMMLNLSITATYRGAQYVNWEAFNITARPAEENVLWLIEQEWLMNGGVAEALPSSKGLTLEFRLANLGESPISTIIPNLTLPKGFEILSYGGTCLGGVASSSACTIDFRINVNRSVKPGTYSGVLRVKYVVNVGGTYMYSSKSFNITVSVKSPREYEPRIILSNVRWGTTAPSTTYGGERLAPFTVTLTNLGRYSASNVYVSIKVVKPKLKIYDSTALCAGTLPSGGVCRHTSYLDLGNVTSGKVRLLVNVTYFITIYGSYIRMSKYFNASLDISTYAAQYLGNIELVSADWAGGNPVYPNTKGATYDVVIANHYPFNIVAIDAHLTNLPRGIKPHRGMDKAYVAGPVPSNQEATLSFTLDVGSGVMPGEYMAKLVIKYVVASGGASLIKEKVFNVTLRIDNVTHGIEVIETGWIGQPAQPGTYGNYLYVVLRDIDYPTVKGLTACVHLPKGITSSVNNASVVKVIATTSAQAASMAAENPARLMKVLSSPKQAAAILSTMQPAGQLGKGDIAFLVIGLNILTDKPGIYWANATLSFIDQWGDLRHWFIKFPINVLGTTLYIKVWSNTVLDFNKSRMETLTIRILNNGSAPIYNVYLTIYSPTSYLLVKSVPIYLGTLEPNTVRIINVTVFYNPMPSPQAPVTITYGNAPFIASLIYTDVLGYRHEYNASFTVSISPFIKLIVQGLKVVKEGSLIKVSGTVTNLGNAQAQRVVAYVKVGNYVSQPSFIGDIDPSSQTSFEVTGNYRGSNNVSEVYLILKYRDPFNEPRQLVIPAKVTEYIPLNTTTTHTPKGLLGRLGTYKLGVIGVVVAFLIGVILLIRRYLKRHEVSEVPV